MLRPGSAGRLPRPGPTYPIQVARKAGLTIIKERGADQTITYGAVAPNELS
jgi:hypothetical protein